MPRRIRRDSIEKLVRIVKFIEENPNTYLRDISRNLGINPATVHRVLKLINDFIEVTSINDKIEANLPNLPLFIRLKEGVTTEGIVKFVATRQKLEL